MPEAADIQKQKQDFLRNFQLMRAMGRDVMGSVPYNIFKNIVGQDVSKNPNPMMLMQGSKGYAICDEMLFDPVIGSFVDTRYNYILGLDWRWEPAMVDEKPSEHPEDIKRRNFIAWTGQELNSSVWHGTSYVGGIAALLHTFMDARMKGCGFIQNIWDTAKGRIVECLHENPSAFDFEPDLEMYPNGNRGILFNMWTGTKLHYREGVGANLEPAPPFKFQHVVNNPKYGNPYGNGQLWRAFWPWVLGFLEGLPSWANFLDKFAMPTWIADIPQELWEDASFVGELIAVMNAAQTAYAGAFPLRDDGKEMVRVLESNRTSSHEVYRGFQREMTAWKALAILGAALTTIEPEFGTRAAAETQEEGPVFNVQKSDADFCMNAMQMFIRWQMDMKFGKPQERYDMDAGTFSLTNGYPSFKLIYERQEDSNQEAERLTKVADYGPVPWRHFQEKFGIPEVEIDKDTGQPELIAQKKESASSVYNAGIPGQQRPPSPPPENETGIPSEIPEGAEASAGGNGKDPHVNADELILQSEMPNFRRMIETGMGNDLDSFFKPQQ